MTPHLSESLATEQAIRYVSAQSFTPDTLRMETNAERRRRKLKALGLSRGGLVAVAERAGLSPESLEQVVKGTLLPPKKGSGERTPRSLGDSAARAIEAAHDLERGWFDNDSETEDMTAAELLLLGYFRMLDPQLQAAVVETVRETAEKRAALQEALASALKPTTAPSLDPPK